MEKNLKVFNKGNLNNNFNLPGDFNSVLGNYIDKDKKKNKEKRIETFDCLNIGVPSVEPVKFFMFIDDLMMLSDNDKKDIGRLGAVILANLYSVFSSINKELDIKCSCILPAPSNGFSFYTDENLKTKIVLSDHMVLYSILSIFGLEDELSGNPYDNYDYGLIGSKLKEKVKKLREIKTENGLRKKYPNLYENYVGYKSHYDEVLAIEQMPLSSKIAAIKEFGICYGIDYSEFREYIKGGFNVEKFINTICDMYEKYADNLKDFMGFISKSPIYFTESCKINEDKLALFAAYHYLNNAMLSDGNKQKYLYYVASYLKEENNKSKKISLMANDYAAPKPNKKMTINYEYIERTFRDMLVDSPELNFIDLSREMFTGLTPEEINDYMDKYLEEIRLNWDFLLPNDETLNKEMIDLINKESKGTKVRDEEAFKEHLMQLYMEKKSLFESSEPFCMLKGKSTFSGYIGYCYDNGKVILDKYFKDEKSKRLAYGEAIYVMDLESFYILSKLSKAEIRNQRLCEWIPHSGEWQQKVKNVINSGKPIAKNLSGIIKGMK